MDKKILVHDLLSKKPAMEISTENYSESNYIALSDNINNRALHDILEKSKKGIKLVIFLY